MGIPYCLQVCVKKIVRTVINTKLVKIRWESHTVYRVCVKKIVRTVINTKLVKIRCEVIRKELEMSGIQEVRLKYRHNWINHLERMDNTRLPKHALKYKPRGRRDRGRPRKRWHCVDAGTGQTT